MGRIMRLNCIPQSHCVQALVHLKDALRPLPPQECALQAPCIRSRETGNTAHRLISGWHGQVGLVTRPKRVAAVGSGAIIWSAMGLFQALRRAL